MKHMFDFDERNAGIDGTEPAAEDEIEAAVTRLVAAFGGGELVAPRATRARRPLSAA
jgi:hypothetical protein